MSGRCPGCGHEVTTATARWCGRCGAALSRARSNPPANEQVNGHATDVSRLTARVPAGATATGDARVASGLAGPVNTLVRGDVLDLTGLDGPRDTEGVETEVPADDHETTRRTRLLALLVAVVTVTGILAIQPEPEVVYPAAGYAAGGEPTRSGRVSYAPLETLPTEVAWTRSLRIPLTRTHVAVGDTVALEIGGNGTVGRDPGNGTARWLRTDLQLAGLPLIGEVVVSNTSNGQIIGFDPTTGRTAWRSQDVQGTVRALDLSGFALAHRGERFTVLDPADGEAQWTRDLRLEGPEETRIELHSFDTAGDLIVVSGTTPPGLIPPLAQHLAVALDARTGETRWIVELPGGIEQGRGVTGARDGTTVWFDPFAGATVIDRMGEILVEGLDASVPEEDIRLGAPGGDVPELEPLESLDPDGSSVVSGRSLGAEVEPLHSAAVLCCSAERAGRAPVVVTSRPSSATAFDAETGEELWRWEPDDASGGVNIRAGSDGTFRGMLWSMDGSTRWVSIDPVSGRVTELEYRVPDENFGIWFDEQGNRFSGDGSSYTVAPADGPERWSATFALSPGGGPAVRDGIVAVPSTTGTEALALDDGAVRWRVSVKSEDEGGLGYRWTTPAIGESIVAASPSTGVFANLKPTDRLTGYDLQTGVSPWARTNDPTPPRGEVTLDDDRAFMAVGREIHGYDIATGRRAFAAKSVDGVEFVAATPTHLIGTPDYSGRARVEVNRLEAIGILRRDRSTAWRRPGSDICTPPAIATGIEVTGPPAGGGLLPAGPVDVAVWGERSTLRAVDVETGEDLWEMPGVGPVCRPLAVADGRAVFLPTFEGDDAVFGAGDDTSVPLGTQIAAVDIATGAYVWNGTLPSPATTAPVIAGEHALVGLADGRVVAVALDTGEVVLETQLDGTPAAPPAVADDGTLLVLLTDGRLVALR